MSPALRRIWRAPAVAALLIQCLSFPLMLIALYALARAGLAPGYWHAALLQGGFAALLSWRRLASWWRPIQLLFPPALLGTHMLGLPPAWFLAGFLVLLLVFWSTFRTQVPYYPSGKAVPDALLALLPPGASPRIVDIGSGLGGLVLELARKRPDARCTGIELAPLPWLISRLRAIACASRARFLRGDYESLDFGNFDLVFAYLSPAAMDGLWRKASREMRPGSVLVSYEFGIDARQSDLCVVPTRGAPPLFVWHF
jgi:hypothetical protein